jgi:hypothetical protein
MVHVLLGAGVVEWALEVVFSYWSWGLTTISLSQVTLLAILSELLAVTTMTTTAPRRRNDPTTHANTQLYQHHSA